MPLARRDRYEVIATLGRGSGTVVLKARDRELDEVIALKVLAPELCHDREAVERLKAEIRIARRVRHPNVARVYDLEEWDGRLCISMELVEGEPLDRKLADGPMPWAAAAAVVHTLALALDSAHALGVVHRDLKPANVVLDRHGNPYVLDFGIALSPEVVDSDSADVIRGSPRYMAPERWRGVPGLPASDLYSLGVLAYELLAGRRPFEGASVRLVMAQHLHAPPPPLEPVAADFPLQFTDLIRKLLAKRPDHRPSAAQAARTLRRLLPRREAALPESRGKVLVVEDEDAVRTLIAELLRRRGATVVEARDGLDGFAMAIEEKPDLILLDIGMPGLDGVGTLRALKSDPTTQARPVIMLSASLDPEHPARSRDLGAAAFLPKPVNADVLDLVLDKYLG